jgi:hypothetical protein
MRGTGNFHKGPRCRGLGPAERAEATHSHAAMRYVGTIKRPRWGWPWERVFADARGVDALPRPRVDVDHST